MVYKDFQGLKISQLGLGTMRLPLKGNIAPVFGTDDSDVDGVAIDEMVAYAMSHGVNYYDTAWGYHSGNSEIAIGNALKKYPRERFFLADKFPGYDLSNMGKVREIFEKQLEKTGAGYFDFYLFHNVCELNVDQYLDPKYGIYDYLMEQKQNGRIRHLGFSAHGAYEVIEKFLNAYGKDMEFCQLQINYLDWEFQDGRKKVDLLKKHNIPIWIMEPLRGGQLCKMSPENAARLAALRPDENATGWAFRFLQSLPDTKVVLSGMSNLQQLKENIQIFEEDKPLNTAEMETILDIADKMVNEKVLPCTACRYCTSHCPQQLNIPSLLAMYNEHIYTGGGFIAPMALAALPRDKRPAACIGCRSCEAVCPQQIKISEALADFVEKLKA